MGKIDAQELLKECSDCPVGQSVKRKLTFTRINLLTINEPKYSIIVIMSMHPGFYVD